MMNIKTRNSLAWAALGLAIAALLWVVYDVTMRFRALNSEDQELHFGDGSTDEVTNASVSFKEVINAHLFGVEPVAAKVDKPKVVNAPKTRLKLKLTGLISTSASEFGYAMIEVSRGETNVVGVGKEIGKTGAKLHAIEPDHILIDHRGKIEKLQLERQILGINEENDLSSETIKQLNLTESELAALIEIGDTDPIEEEQYGDDSFIEDEEVNERVEEEVPLPDEQTDSTLEPLEKVPGTLNQI